MEEYLPCPILVRGTATMPDDANAKEAADHSSPLSGAHAVPDGAPPSVRARRVFFHVLNPAALSRNLTHFSIGISRPTISNR